MTDLNNGCISSKMWDEFVPNFAHINDYTLEEVEAVLNPNIVLCGFLDPELPKKKLRMSLSKSASKLKTTEMSIPSTSQFAVPVSNEQFTEAVKGVVPTNTKKNNSLSLSLCICVCTEPEEAI